MLIPAPSLCYAATAFVGYQLFDVYTYSPPPEDLSAPGGNSREADEDDGDELPASIFEVNLLTWLACLNIYGTAGLATGTPGTGSLGKGRVGGSGDAYGGVGGDDGETRRQPFSRAGQTFVEMSYGAKGQPLVLELKEGKVSTRCELSTSEDSMSISEMPYVSERTENQIIMQSKDLTEAFLSIDASSRLVSISFHDPPPWRPKRPGSSLHPRQTPRRGAAGAASTLDTTADDEEEDREAGVAAQNNVAMMRIRASGDLGSTELDFPNRKKIFESFVCHIEGTYHYDFKMLQHCLRALQSSTKCSMRIDSAGMMSLQCMFPVRPLAPDRNGAAGELDAAGAAGRPRPREEQRGFVEIRLQALADEATDEAAY